MRDLGVLVVHDDRAILDAYKEDIHEKTDSASYTDYPSQRGLCP